MQFSIASLSLLVAMVTLSLAVLKTPSQLLVDLHYTTVWLTLISALIAYRGATEPRRSFLLGFALLGSAHQWLVHSFIFAGSFGPRLLTIDLAELIDYGSKQGLAAARVLLGRLSQDDGQLSRWRFVLPSILSWLVGLAGGWIAIRSKQAQRD